jgi:hypothetical protein
VTHHAPTSGYQDEEERSEQLGTKSPPFLAWIVEVGYSLNDLLFVASDRAQLWDLFECSHFHPVSISARRKSSPASGDERL